MSYIIRPYRKGRPLSSIILLQSLYTQQEAERFLWRVNAQEGITAHLELPGDGTRMPREGRGGVLEGPRTRETLEGRL